MAVPTILPHATPCSAHPHFSDNEHTDHPQNLMQDKRGTKRTTTPKIAVSYARASREHDDAFGIASQLLGNREYAKTHGLHLPAEYEFAEEFTGRTIERPQLSIVRQLVRQRKLQALIIHVTDRLARKLSVGEFLLDELLAYGVELHIVVWGRPVHDTPEDRTRFTFEMRSSDYERQKIRDRTDRGRRQKLTGSDGIRAAWLGQGAINKYGFTKVGKKRNTTMVLVPEEAQVIRLIFDLYVHQHKGPTEIARHLNAAGVPTRSQAKGFDRMLSTRWTRTEVYKILKDERYTGVWWANQQVSIKGKPHTRPKEEWIRLDFPELRIIDDATFTEAQTKLAAGRKGFTFGATHQYLMARCIRCVCGYATAVTTYGRSPSTVSYSYYYCSARNIEHAPACPIPKMRGDILEEQVWRRVEALLTNPAEQLAILRHAQAEMTDRYSEIIARMQECEATRSEYQRRLAIYSDQEAEGLISREMFREKKAQLDQQLAAAEEVYGEYQQMLANKILTDGDLLAIHHELSLFQSQAAQPEMLDFEQKRRLIETLHITGAMQIVDGWQVLSLSIYTAHFATLKLQALDLPSDSQDDTAEQVV